MHTYIHTYIIIIYVYKHTCWRAVRSIRRPRVRELGIPESPSPDFWEVPRGPRNCTR